MIFLYIKQYDQIETFCHSVNKNFNGLKVDIIYEPEKSSCLENLLLLSFKAVKSSCEVSNKTYRCLNSRKATHGSIASNLYDVHSATADFRFIKHVIFRSKLLK